MGDVRSEISGERRSPEHELGFGGGHAPHPRQNLAAGAVEQGYLLAGSDPQHAREIAVIAAGDEQAGTGEAFGRNEKPPTGHRCRRSADHSSSSRRATIVKPTSA